jgi:adenosylhomocysteinase
MSMMEVARSALPVLTSLSRSAPPPPKVRSLLMTHVLETSVPYIKTVHEVYPIDAVMAIPYSSQRSAIEELQRAGILIRTPSSIPEAFRVAEAMILSALRESSTPLVAQEVGGYLANASRPLAEFPHFIGVVEDTNSGHWRYERTAPHPFPVLSIARSPLKDIEDTLIGDAVAFSLERILREDFRTVIQGCHVGVLGYGKIGTSTAIAMRGRESSVSVYDINPVRTIRAKFEGFAIQPLHDLLQQSDIVIGCSGQTSLKTKDLPWIRDRAILVSATSKAHEFDLPSFAEVCGVEEMNEVVTRYLRPDGRPFFVLNKGTPVNFRDHSILGSVLDLIYSELFVAMRTLVAGHGVPGLSVTGDEIHQEVSRVWLNTYVARFAETHADEGVERTA